MIVFQLIGTILFIGYIYIGYLLAFKYKSNLLAGYYKGKYPEQLEKKVCRYVGMNVMIMFFICTITVWVPMYMSKVGICIAIWCIYMIFFGYHRVIKKYYKYNNE